MVAFGKNYFQNTLILTMFTSEAIIMVWVQVDNLKGYSTEKFLFRKVFLLKGHYWKKEIILKNCYSKKFLSQRVAILKFQIMKLQDNNLRNKNPWDKNLWSNDPLG